MDDDSLIRNAVAGDAHSLETLLLGCFDRLTALASRKVPADLRSALSPEDVVQDAFIVAFERISCFEPRGSDSFFAWLARITENRLLDAVKALRAAKRGGGRRHFSDDADGLAPVLELLSAASRSPSRSAAAHDAVAKMESALEALDPDYREVIRLRYIELLPVAECAKRLGRSDGAVHMLLSRAMSALRARLGDSERFLTRKT